METSVNTLLTWAVPVRPDLLGSRLEAFKQILPQLQTLRLCHRFGKGPSVFITRLPTEVERMIERCVPLECSGIWQDSFMHFEKRCEPLDHVEDGYFDMLEAAEEELSDVLCEGCQDRGSFENQFECTKDCWIEVSIMMNERVRLNHDYVFDVCEETSSTWEDLINQAAGKRFEQCDKILHQHFGLSAYLAYTRIGNVDGPWTKEYYHMWHERDELQTTICYLTLPGVAAVRNEFDSSLMERECGLGMMYAHQSCFLGPVVLSERDDIAGRFHHALHVLGLRPHVHESQLNHTLSASPAKPLCAAAVADHTSKASQDITDGTESACSPQSVVKQENKSTNARNHGWPKLVFLVNAKVNPY